MSLPLDAPAWRRHAPLLLVVLLGMLLYGHTLHAPFYLDDAGAIYDNKVIQDLAKAAAGVFTKRGLATLTFALNYRFGELNPVGYHLVNIGIHLGAACLVLLLLRRLFPGRWLPPLFGALIFVAHPLQTQGVTYLVQRMTSLSALLFLLAIYLFALARECLAIGAAFNDRRHLCCYGGALLAGGAAILAKENAVVLPLALCLFAWLTSPVGIEDRRGLVRYLAPFLVLPLLAVVGYLLMPLFGTPQFDTLGYSRHLRSMEGNSPLNYLATQCSVLWIYLRMLFLPYGQALDHAYPVSRELLTVKSVVGGSGLLGLLGLAWWLRRRQPEISFAIAWFFLTLLVESSIIPLDPLFEHRLYLPVFGLAVLGASLLERLPKLPWQYGMATAVILALAVLTWQRNALWNDPIAFFEDNLRVSPDNERVMFNLGQQYFLAGGFARGEALVRESIALNPERHFGYLALKELYVSQDRLEEAVGMLRYGIGHVERKYKGQLLNDLAFIYGKSGDYEQAVALLQQAIAEDPAVPATYYNLAQMLMFAGRAQEMEVYLRKTLALDPNHADARQLLDSMP
jgi:protein O-mannosyl-transferase